MPPAAYTSFLGTRNVQTRQALAIHVMGQLRLIDPKADRRITLD